MLRNEGETLTRVVVCPPADEYCTHDDPGAHGMSGVPDRERALAQYRALRSALDGERTEVIEVPELPGHPNSVFTRDTALITPGGHVRLRMGLETRRGEEEWMSEIVRGLGAPCIGTIETPGTVEGGDVILAGQTAFVGLSSRSNASGVEQLTAILEQQGYEVRVAQVGDEYMHIGGLMSMVGPRRILCCSGLFPEGYFTGYETIEIDWYGPSCANVICLRPDEVIVNAAEAGPTIEVLEAAGLTVHGLDMSEYRTGGGGPTCTILPVERVPGL